VQQTAKALLTTEQSEKVNALLQMVRDKLVELSAGDAAVQFAMRRKLYIRLQYDERGNPAHRAKLKSQKWKAQRGRCAICDHDLPETGAELDRFHAPSGYTPENTQLVHHECHRKQQAERRYT
jgi:hypothetical protein